MSNSPETLRSSRLTRLIGGAALVATTGAACAGGVAVGGGATDVATEAEWRALATARPEPLPGAARLAFDRVEMLVEPSWTIPPGVSPELGLSELVVAGLLRRRDVHFVERRRFAAAAAAERAGTPRRPGAPPVGVSPGAELEASVAWAATVPPRSTLEVRLADAETGALVSARRVEVPLEAEPVGLARAVVSAILQALDELGRRPVWTDPIAGAAVGPYTVSGTSSATLGAFIQGLRAEEQWSWDSARRAYQAAARGVGLFEASVVLARTARLRLGGTLGES